jgi:hypothetical protein
MDYRGIQDALGAPAAYVTGTVNQELVLRNEYLAAENRILRGQIQGRLLLSEGEKATLAEIAHRLGRKALEDVAPTAKPDAILGWYRTWQRQSDPVSFAAGGKEEHGSSPVSRTTGRPAEVLREGSGIKVDGTAVDGLTISTYI